MKILGQQYFSKDVIKIQELKSQSQGLKGPKTNSVFNRRQQHWLSLLQEAHHEMTVPERDVTWSKVEFTRHGKIDLGRLQSDLIRQ